MKYCSFCCKSEEEVAKMISGQGTTYICNECVLLAYDVLSESGSDVQDGESRGTQESAVGGDKPSREHSLNLLKRASRVLEMQEEKQVAGVSHHAPGNERSALTGLREAEKDFFSRFERLRVQFCEPTLSRQRRQEERDVAIGFLMVAKTLCMLLREGSVNTEQIVNGVNREMKKLGASCSEEMYEIYRRFIRSLAKEPKPRKHLRKRHMKRLWRSLRSG
jgi:hypothetical protein